MKHNFDLVWNAETGELLHNDEESRRFWNSPIFYTMESAELWVQEYYIYYDVIGTLTGHVITVTV